MTDYRGFLLKLHRNLNTLRERESKYLDNTPLELLNQIEDHQQAISLTEQALKGELSETQWREALAPLNLSLTPTANIFQVVINTLPRPVWIGLAVALVIILGVGIANLEPVRVALFATATPTITPTLTPTPDPTPTPLPVVPAAQNETLILIATFHHTAGVADTDAHNEIRRAISAAMTDLAVKDLRVEVEPSQLTGDDPAAARKLGERYGASMVIWGSDTGVRVTVNFLNLKEPDYKAAEVKISETEQTQLANPSAYAHFITEDLPAQMTFLALYAVGQSYLIQSEFSQALPIIESAIAVLPREVTLPMGIADAYHHLGYLYQNQGENNKALASYNQAIELDPQLDAPFNNRGAIYKQQGDYERALADFNQAIALDPKSATPYNNRGIIYFDQGDYNRAKMDYEKAIALDPKYPQAYNNRGLLYYEQGEYARAMSDYDKAIELDPELAIVYSNRGIVHHIQGDYEQAMADYNRAIELNPKYPDAYSNRGVAYRSQGDYERALADHNQAIKLNPQNAKAYLNRGETFFKQGNYQQAIADYNKAIELN